MSPVGLNSRKFKEAIEMTRTHTAFRPQSTTLKTSVPRTQVEILVLNQTIRILDNLLSPSAQSKRGWRSVCGRKRGGPRGNLGVSAKPPYFLKFHQAGEICH